MELLFFRSTNDVTNNVENSSCASRESGHRPLGFINKYPFSLLAVFLHQQYRWLHIASAVNGNQDYYLHPYPLLQVNTEYSVEIRQRYKSGGVYKYSILLNGEEIHSTDNTQAQQFYDVKVSIGDQWYPECKGTISELKITNFL